MPKLEQLKVKTGAHGYRLDSNERYGARDLGELVLAQMDVQPGERVLDFGCGKGKFLIPFARAAGPEGTVVGSDLDEAALEQARGQAEQEGLDVELVAGSMDDIGSLMGDRRFDKAACCYALYYANDPANVLRQVAGLLDAPGRLFVVGPGPGNNGELFDLLSSIGAEHERAVPADFMTRIAAGTCEGLFDEVEQIPFDNPVAYPSADAVAEYWRSSAYYDQSLEDEFDAAVERAFAEDGGFTITKRALAVSASGIRESG